MPEPAQRQAAGSENSVPSPCIRVCSLGDNDTCLGCFRTLEEIAAWSRSSDNAKRRILTQAALRKSQRSHL